MATNQLSVNIATKEFVPVVTAAAVWGRQWACSHVCFHVYNLAVVSILNQWSAKNPLLSHLLRCLFFFSMFHFSAEHVPCSSNTATTLSHDNIHIISLLVPQVLQATVPPPFKSSSYSRHLTGPHIAGPVCSHIYISSSSHQPLSVSISMPLLPPDSCYQPLPTTW